MDRLNGRNQAFDRFRGLGAICVVLLHAPPLYHSSLEPLRATGWVLRELCQVAVPFFFLLSGWILGGKWVAGRRQDAELQRTSRRILSLYLPWFVFFLVLDLAASLPSEPMVVLRRLVGFSDGSLDTRGYHLWFLPSLFWAQGLVWLSLRRSGSAAMAAVAGGVLYLAMGVLDAVGQKLPWGLAPHEGLNISLLCVGVGAWMASDSRIPKKPGLGSLVVASLLLVWIEAGLWDAMIGTRWSVHSFQLSRVLFPALLLAWLSDKPGFWAGGFFGKVLDFIGVRSTGIYVMHLAFLALVPFESMIANGFIRDNFVRWSIAIGGSIVATELLRRAPWTWCRNLAT